MSRLALATLALVVVVSHVTAQGLYCCPSCTANNGDCRLVNEVYGLFSSGRACLDACPGSCVKSTTGFVCGLEPCGPNPCPSAALGGAGPAAMVPELRLRGSHAPVGTCKMGKNASGMPLRGGTGWWGDYAYSVSVSNDLRRQQVPIATHWTTDPVEAKLVVANGGNNVYWPVSAAGTQQWTLDARVGAQLIHFNFSLPTDAYPPTIAASDELVAFATQDGEYLAYDAQHPPNTLISRVTDIPPNNNGDVNPVFVEGTTVYVLNLNAQSGYDLYWYDAFLPDTIHHVAIDFKSCNVPGTKDAANSIQGGAVKGGNFVFPANNQYGDSQFWQLCQTDTAAGTTAPLLTGVNEYTRALSSLEVSFFDSAVIYTAYGGDGGIPEGDIVACTEESGEWDCTWVNQAIKTKSDYTFTKLYTNYHMPAPVDAPAQIVIFEDVLVYRTYGETFDYSFFSYNLTDSSVAPVALTYDVPNTKCDTYTGDNSASLEERSFIQSFVLANGTLLFGVQYTDSAYGFQQNDVVSVESPVLLQSLVGCDATGGCAPHGGTCANRQCYCQPGCSGVDCSSGASYCNPVPPPSDDDF